MIPLKEPRTYEEQLENLKRKHNLIVEDDSKAIEILKRVNYYRLSGYGLGLTQPTDKELYKDGITLEHIYRLYTFDSKFRSILFHTIEQIEIQLRAQMSNYFALTYGAEGYMLSENFDDKTTKSGVTVHEKLMADFQRECEQQKNTPFVQHHMDKYEGRFPMWVAVELFSFGNISSLYSIMKPTDKKAIADLYNTSPWYLTGWILSLVEIRNLCAHYSRIYNMPLKQAPALYKEHRQYRQGSINKLFPVLLVLKRCLNEDWRKTDDERWKRAKKEIVELFSEYEDVVNLSYIGFPPNWQDVL